jgi:hypothetical protein
VKNLVLFLLIVLSFQGSVKGQSENLSKHISHWASKNYFQLELTVDLNPKFITNWEFNIGADLNSVVRSNFAYQQFAGWIGVLAGIDLSIWNFSLFEGFIQTKCKVGSKIGADNFSYFAFVFYTKEEVLLKSWKSKGYEAGSCNKRTKSLNFVLYENICKNSRREGKFYFELRGGLNFKF